MTTLRLHLYASRLGQKKLFKSFLQRLQGHWSKKDGASWDQVVASAVGAEQASFKHHASLPQQVPAAAGAAAAAIAALMKKQTTAPSLAEMKVQAHALAKKFVPGAKCEDMEQVVVQMETEHEDMPVCTAMAGAYGADKEIHLEVDKHALTGTYTSDDVDPSSRLKGTITEVTASECSGFAMGPLTAGNGDGETESQSFTFVKATNTITWKEGIEWLGEGASGAGNNDLASILKEDEDSNSSAEDELGGSFKCSPSMQAGCGEGRFVDLSVSCAKECTKAQCCKAPASEDTDVDDDDDIDNIDDSY